MSSRVFQFTRSILYLLWAAIAFSLLMRIHPVAYALSWIPPQVRSAINLVGNLWGMMAVPSLAFYYLFRYLSNMPAIAHSPARRALIRTAGTAAVAAPFAVAGAAAIVERTNFQIKEVDLPIPGLHPDLEGLRLGQLSDLHISPWLSVKELGRAIDMLNELKPHLTLVTGDLITQVGDPLDETIRELSRLRADAGVMGCLGNHEMYTKCQNYATERAAHYGIDFVRQQARVLRFGNGVINIAGVDFQRKRETHPYLAGVEHLMVPGMTNVLLSHNPDVFPAAVKQGYDAVISGHTHGGQLTMGVLSQTLNPARLLTPFVAGLYRLEGKSCYVTAGLGTIAIPVRINTPPEITLLRLRKA